MPATLFVVASALSAMLGASSLQQAGDTSVPLDIVLRPSPGGDTIDVELTNHGSKTAVAWALKYQYPPSVGRSGGAIEQDFYPQLVTPGKGDSPGPIEPNKSRVVLTVPSDAYAGATLVAVSVVYDDGTAVGDERQIRPIFDRRTSDARTWKELSATLNKLARGRVSAATVQSALDSIEATPQAEGSGKRQLVIKNLALLLKSPSTLESGLKSFAAKANRYAEAAAVHAVRR